MMFFSPVVKVLIFRNIEESYALLRWQHSASIRHSEAEPSCCFWQIHMVILDWEVNPQNLSKVYPNVLLLFCPKHLYSWRTSQKFASLYLLLSFFKVQCLGKTSFLLAEAVASKTILLRYFSFEKHLLLRGKKPRSFQGSFSYLEIIRSSFPK